MTPIQDLVVRCITSATSTERVFGELQGDTAGKLWQLRLVRRRLATAIDPKQMSTVWDRQEAINACKRLDEWFLVAKAQVESGSYGRQVAA